MILYHYTRPNLWKHISQGTGEQGFKGLVPKSMPTESGNSPYSVFTLTDPLPASWRLNKDYPDAWSDLISLDSGIGQMLLEVEVAPTDRIRVYDYAYILFTNTYCAYDSKAREDGDFAYLSHGLSLDSYLERLRGGQDFSLPEVLIQNPVPLERLRVSATQPLIDQVIDGNAPFRYRTSEQQEDRRVLLQEIQAVSELAPWAQRCKEAMITSCPFVRKER